MAATKLLKGAARGALPERAAVPRISPPIQRAIEHSESGKGKCALWTSGKSEVVSNQRRNKRRSIGSPHVEEGEQKFLEAQALRVLGAREPRDADEVRVA